MGEPQPIETAPLDKPLLLWWTPKNANVHVETWVIGEVSSYEPGKWWCGQNGHYQELERIKYWLPLPPKPQQSDAKEAT